MQALKNKVSAALRASESLFKLDMVYLAKGGMWTSLSFLVGTMASLATMIAFGNLLPREAYGTYNYLLSLGASLSFLTLSGIGIAVMRAVARGNESVTHAALKLELKFNLVAISTILAAALYYGYKGNMLFAGSLAILAIAYPLAESFHIYKQVLTGKKRFDLLTKVTSITTLISTSATIITLFLTDNILILIAVYASVSLFPNIIIYRKVARDLDKTPPDPEQIKEMRRTAFHLTGAGVIGVISSYIDKIMLFQVAGPATLAVYGFAIAGPDRMKSLIKGWMSIALPRLAQTSLPEIRKVVYRRIIFCVLVGVILFVIYLLVAPLLFKIFLPRYLDSILYSKAYALSLLVAPVAIYLGGVFTGQNMIRATYALNLGNHIVRISLFIILGWFWHIWGLILASIIYNVLSALYSIIIWEVEYRRLMKKNEQS
jgi:O-antigen/teichoic acid export membrane protein